MFSLINDKQSFIDSIKLEVYSTLTLLASPFFLFLSIYYFLDGLPVFGSLLFQIFFILLLDAIWIKKYREMIVSYPIVYVVENVTLLYGLSVAGSMVLFWAYPLCLSIIFIISHRYIKHVLSFGYMVAVIAAYFIIDGEELMHFSISLLILCLISYYLEKVFVKYDNMLIDIVNKDALTKAYNFRHMEDTLDRVIDEVQSGYTPASIILLEMEGVNTSNNMSRYKEKDKILVTIVNNIQGELKKKDYLFRMDELEFLILLKDVTESRRTNTVKNIIETIKKSCLESEYNLNYYMGLSECVLDDNLESWLNRAKNNLFNAKKLEPNSIYPPVEQISIKN